MTSTTDPDVHALLREMDQVVDNAIAEADEPPLQRILAPDFI